MSLEKDWNVSITAIFYLLPRRAYLKIMNMNRKHIMKKWGEKNG